MMSSVTSSNESSSEPPANSTSNESSSEPPAHSTRSMQDVLPMIPPAPTSPRMSFFDEEYAGGRRVPSPVLQQTVSPPANAEEGSSNRDGVAPEDLLTIHARIHSVLNQQYLPEFKEHLIPSHERAPDYHNRLHELLQRRNRVESRLEILLKDEAPDGTPLSPSQYSEPEYMRLSALVDKINRSMLTIYADYLGAQAKYIQDSKSLPAARKRPSDTADMVRPAKQAATIHTTDPANTTDTITVPRPYEHARDQPVPPPTTPQFEEINLTDTGNRALLAGIPVQAHSLGISAIADTGASHILLREEDAFLLTNIQRCKQNQPFATLKAANGSVLKATGRGNFIIAKVVVEAFIFRNDDLAANLLGVIPFSNLGCTAVFRPHWFGIYPQHDNTPIVVGTRASKESLWVVDLAQFLPHAELGHSDGIPPPCSTDPGVYIEANAIALHDNASYVKFVHACLGYPTPSTFLRAVTAGYITGPHQFPRLTPKMVRKYIPNAMPTAKGHLDRRPSTRPHAESDSISARIRHHSRETRNRKVRFADTHMQLDTASLSDNAAFVRTHANRSTRMHMDYTGAMPERCSAGTLFFQVSVWGGYINLQPLRSMRSEHTVPAFEAAVNFYRHRGATIDTIRMDNQRSQPLIQMARSLDMQMELVTPYVKNPNRAERAIRTTKNHIISTRAGFHPHCPHMYLDKCLMQIEMTLNITRPFEFDHAISAYEGLFGVKFNFKQHPIAPVGTKVLTWDAPDHRGSWADHGVEAVYLGPAMEHLRSFDVWVPNTSAPRITNTVWWFLHDLTPDDALLSADTNLMYPRQRHAHSPWMMAPI